MIVCFFFSSRRRHTRFDCDWSSDVCSSDLWSQTGELAARCAVGLQQDLKKMAAPGDLIELANQAAIQLKLRTRERDSSDRKSTRLNSSHSQSRMPSSA